MNTMHRRYEILLPTQYNDGRPVPDDLLAQTVIELRQHFGAISHETQSIQGEWETEGRLYRDRLTRIFLDVADTKEHRAFFAELKMQLIKRFEQIDIWITSYPIDII